MALSNILKEPRREITETLVGVSLLTIPVGLSYLMAIDIPWDDDDPSGLIARMALSLLILALGGVALMVGAAVITLFTLAIHAAGEAICDALDRRGIRLRPRRRPEQ